MKTYNWEGVNPDGYFLDKLEPIPSALPSFQKLFQVSVTEQSVRFQTALASIKLIQASAVLDLTEDDFDFLTSNKVWIATDRSRARRCVEACVYGTLDFVGYP